MSLKKSVISVAVMTALGSLLTIAQATPFEAMGQKDYVISANGGTNDERVFGGWNVESGYSAEKNPSKLNTDVSVMGGDWKYIFGGSYVKTGGQFNMGSSNLLIGGETKGYGVVGGMAASSANGAVITGESSSLTITGGHFRDKSPLTNIHNIIEHMVVGGDLIKHGGADHGTFKTTADLEKAKLSISGGTFETPIIGGSVAYGYYDGTYSTLEVHVDQVEMNITGGTFSKPIVAGGMVRGAHSSSTVGSSVLNITGSSEKPDALKVDRIYTGSLYVQDGNCNHNSHKGEIVKASASVGSVTLNIKNVTAEEISDSDVHAQQPDEKGPWIYTSYTPNESENTPTLATLTNVTASIVDLSNALSTLTLRVENNGETAIETLNFDGVIVAEADGATNDAVNGNVNTFLSQKLRIANIKEIQNDMTLTLEEGEGIGEVTADVAIDENGQVAVTNNVEKANTKNNEIANELSAIPSMITRAELNDVRKRMGDLRSSTTAHGSWARYEGGKMSGLGMENTFNKVQVGVDTMLPTDVRVGVAFSYTDGEVEGQKTTAETDTYSLAAYGTWFGDKGQFVDVIGRMATIKTDLTAGFGLNTDIDQVALSLSGQFGWRFDVTESFYVEPSVEATYTFLNSDSFANATSGYQYELDDTHSLIAKLGASAGFKCPSDKGDVYIRAGVVREFLGDADMTVSKVGVDPRTTTGGGSDTWFEYGVGANINFAKNAYFWVDAERTSGAEIEEDWRATAGVRFNF